jgi:glycosyltransferase involved in cell wall biosynthesis
MNLKNKNFGLFMTRGMSLEKWDKIGSLRREIKPYQKLSEFFNEVYIFTYGEQFDTRYLKLFPENVHIVCKPKFLPSNVYSFLLPFIHRSKLSNIDILKTNQMDGSWSAVISKKLYNNKLVVRCGYEWLQTLEKSKKSFIKRYFAFYAEKLAYMNADRVILTSEDSKKFVVQRLNISPDTIQIIPNYIDVDLFKPLNIDKEKGRIIFIGRLEKDKNLVNLFYSLEGVDANLVVIGSGSMRGELEQIAKDKNIKVVFKGNIEQTLIPQELNVSEIFVLSSLYEGNPKVLLEAMACGLPCIGTDVEGINSVISHMNNGILSNFDSASMQKAVRQLLGDKELCVKLGASARKSIETNNSFEVCLEKELTIYQTALK